MGTLIRFIADGSFISKAIGWREAGKPSHVEYLILDDLGNPILTFGSRLQGGILYRPYYYCRPTWEEWYTFPGIDASFKEALTLEGRKYDWKDILALAIGIHPAFYDPEKAICSVCIGYSNRLAWAKGTAPALVNPSLPAWEMTPEIIYAAVTQMIKKVK